MAADTLKYAIGNSASTTLSVAISNSDTSATLTSDTNFAAKTGEGMVIMDESQATEELAYATGKSGSALTIPLVNRGLEGGSAQAHSINATVKGILTAGMWNDMIDSLTNVLLKTTGALDTSKVVAMSGNQTIAGNKTFSGTTAVAGLTATSVTTNTIAGSSQFPKVSGEYDNGNSGTSKAIDWSKGDRQKITMTGSCTFTFSNATAGQTLTLRVIIDGTGGYDAPTFPTLLWPAATATTPTMTASAINLFIFYYDGTNYLAQGAANFS